VVVRKSGYDYDALRRLVFDMLGRIDGGGLVGRGARVLVKPNLLAAARPKQAITTHPLLVKAACEYALERGAEVAVGDSPPLGSFEKIVKATGLREALGGMPVALKELASPRRTKTGERFRDVELSGDALEADAIINLPKLKTHSQMTLTLAVKNFYGCVVGTTKGEWHLRVGENKDLFAELLASIYKALPPSISLLDGVLALEGDGPGTGGSPRRLGILLGSPSATALDEAVCRMLGVEPAALPLCRAARRMGLEAEYALDGALPAFDDFVIPREERLVFGPGFLRGFLRRHLTIRPECDGEACALCAECARMCPAGALELKERRLSFDYDRCIRCYCCLEVCPHGALRRREPLLRRIVKRII
jgi:uncharacterized protein (DUF362 family)/Pyruvate/2-oxoacid:ferredoxin oxidoreductase delta subunit